MKNINIILTRSSEENCKLKQKISFEIANKGKKTGDDIRTNRSYSVKFLNIPMISYRNENYNYKKITKELLFHDYIIITSKYSANILNTHLNNDEFISYLTKKYKELLINNSSFYSSDLNHNIIARDILKKKIFLVVGNTSATLLRSCNLDILYLAKNVDDLIIYLNNNVITNKDSILYLSGNNITKDISKYTQIKINRVIIYNIDYTNKLNRLDIENIKNNKIDFILFYSYNSCLTFNKITSKYNLKPYLKNISIGVISNKLMIFMQQFYNKVFIFNKVSQLIDQIKLT
ncbi:MAG TPA: uroporphyrinogen-III synthase [Candidatus Megaira endosymbiont of Hartmannula sinica]|nr:uroporphyrinogen-III synthase [Candidatus Megaera endosymbiont of Hartmannula sinica]